MNAANFKNTVSRLTFKRAENAPINRLRDAVAPGMVRRQAALSRIHRGALRAATSKAWSWRNFAADWIRSAGRAENDARR